MFKKLFRKLGKKSEEKKDEGQEEIVDSGVEETPREEAAKVDISEMPDGSEAEVQKESEQEAKQEIEQKEYAAEIPKEHEAIEEIQPEEENVQVEEEQEEAEEPVEEVQEEEEEKPSKFNLFARLKEGLSKTKKGITERIDTVLKSYGKVDEELFEELEEVLITSDMGFETTMKIIESLKDRVKRNKVTEASDVRDELKEVLVEMLSADEDKKLIEGTPAIILVIGVNGVGKTTTIGKMANRFKGEGKKVLIAAGDTFRAAAIDQLEVWAERAGVDIVSHSEGADPGAVIFDAVQAAKSRKADVLICDTAGRLHNKKNLMNELGKIFKIVDREYPDAHREVLLVVDATTGQNAVQQAKVFNEVADITGIVLTKLDGTAKGGVIFAVKSEIEVPVKLIGVGEKVDDLQDFDARSFVDALFE
ncbi:signal recognition particle-docking protein FtsY [Peptoclostridium litorale DSM 5388]|uniref:Signal recognition particle receptor FtsY n=1 Tax=Peptoclostridium litorale DSM 5388 TaxID=1121324 RepID=A0A069RBL8_PEPLI|nr:signal recognition particle-docking protein FtsY [Peptoclostridium litorale]KDR94148.1 signal recognition particle receptor FtsY [Peptoclostridium litorale DSM 5388]SIN81475.1 signal recognition particle-docking protein FtsY [Peptoclostridium litorale DSM 5388]